MKNKMGFTFIELLIFIVITSLVATAIALSASTLTKAPTLLQLLTAKQTAMQCMEWYLGQNLTKGFSSITCPSTAVPSFCTTPSGYTLSVNVACTTYNSDTNYKTISVTVTGAGSANLSLMIGS